MSDLLVLLTFLRDVLWPAVHGPAKTWFHVDDGDLVVAVGSAVPEAILGPPAHARVGATGLVSAQRPLTGPLPRAIGGQAGARFLGVATDGTTCELVAAAPRALCLLRDEGQREGPGGLCTPLRRTAAEVCRQGERFLLSALRPKRGGAACDAVVAFPIPDGGDPGARAGHWRPAPPQAKADAELLAAFRATHAWAERQEAYAMEPDVEGRHKVVPPWDSHYRARPVLARHLPPPGLGFELATASSDLRRHADGGAPTQVLATIFWRPPGGAWTELETFERGEAPSLFIRDGEGALVALWPESGHGAEALRYELGPLGPKGESLSFATEGYRVPDLSDQWCLYFGR